MNIAYVRVSTKEQNTGRQLEALKKCGIQKMYEEKIRYCQEFFAHLIWRPLSGWR